MTENIYKVRDTCKELIVMSWAGVWGDALKFAISDPFTAKTGIKIKHQYHVGLKLPSTLLEGTTSEVDVVWSNVTPAMEVAEREQAIWLNSDELPNMKLLVNRGTNENFNGFDYYSRVVPVYVVYFVLVYHCSSFLTPPESWDILWNKKFKDKVVLYPGGHGFYPVAQVMGNGRIEDIPNHMQACWDSVGSLAPQLAPPTYSIGMEQPIREQKICLTFRALSNALWFQKQNLNIGWTIPKEGTTDTVDVMWIPKNIAADKCAAAKAYINFALSQNVQSDWCNRLGTMPINKKATISDLLRGCQRLPDRADDYRGILYVSEKDKLSHYKTWEKKFNQLCQTLE